MKSFVSSLIILVGMGGGAMAQPECGQVEAGPVRDAFVALEKALVENETDEAARQVQALSETALSECNRLILLRYETHLAQTLKDYERAAGLFEQVAGNPLVTEQQRQQTKRFVVLMWMNAGRITASEQAAGRMGLDWPIFEGIEIQPHTARLSPVEEVAPVYPEEATGTGLEGLCRGVVRREPDTSEGELSELECTDPAFEASASHAAGQLRFPVEAAQRSAWVAVVFRPEKSFLAIY